MNSRNIKQITTLQLPKVIELCMKADLMPYIMGVPGIGKSQMIESYARKYAESIGRKFVIPTKPEDWNKDNFCFSTIIVNQLSEVDTMGLPIIATIPETGEKITLFSMSGMFPYNPDAMGFLLYDEFTNARPNIQTAFQSVCTSRVIGNRKISPGVRFVFAGNRPEDGTYEITPAMKNRVLWYELTPSPMDKFFDTMSEIGRPIEISIQAAYHAGILSPHMDNYNNNETNDQYCYGSRRMIEYVSNGIKGLTNLDHIELIVSGGLGETAGAKFKAFLKLSVNVDIEDILKNPENINKYDQNGGLLYSICAAIVDRTVNKKDKVAATIKVANAVQYSEYSMFMLLALKNKIGLKPLITTLKDIPEGKDVLQKMVEIVKTVESN